MFDGMLVYYDFFWFGVFWVVGVIVFGCLVIYVYFCVVFISFVMVGNV